MWKRLEAFLRDFWILWSGFMKNSTASSRALESDRRNQCESPIMVSEHARKERAAALIALERKRRLVGCLVLEWRRRLVFPTQHVPQI